MTKDNASEFDGETMFCLSISAQVLERYFGMTPSEAESAMRNLFARRGGVYDELMVHHEGPWRVAAAAAYYSDQARGVDGFTPWLREHGFEAPSEEAHSFIRERFREAGWRTWWDDAT